MFEFINTKYGDTFPCEVYYERWEVGESAMADFQGKVTIVTGAKGGLGSTVTVALLNAGAAVFGISRSIRQADFDYARFFALPAELNSSEAARSVVDAVVARAGRVDVLVHLVGAFAGGTGVSNTDDSMLDEMLNVNLKSAFFMLKAVLPPMQAQRSGHIITIGSRAAIEPSRNAGAYSASKAALLALTKVVASENSEYGISANILLPGTMDTPANRKAMPKADFSKWVQPAQVARLIVSLASDELSDVNGAAIPIYGRDL